MKDRQAFRPNGRESLLAKASDPNGTRAFTTLRLSQRQGFASKQFVLVLARVQAKGHQSFKVHIRPDS